MLTNITCLNSLSGFYSGNLPSFPRCPWDNGAIWSISCLRAWFSNARAYPLVSHSVHLGPSLLWVLAVQPGSLWYPDPVCHHGEETAHGLLWRGCVLARETYAFGSLFTFLLATGNWNQELFLFSHSSDNGFFFGICPWIQPGKIWNLHKILN